MRRKWRHDRDSFLVSGSIFQGGRTLHRSTRKACVAVLYPLGVTVTEMAAFFCVSSSTISGDVAELGEGQDRPDKTVRFPILFRAYLDRSSVKEGSIDAHVRRALFQILRLAELQTAFAGILYARIRLLCRPPEDKWVAHVRLIQHVLGAGLDEVIPSPRSYQVQCDRRARARFLDSLVIQRPLSVSELPQTWEAYLFSLVDPFIEEIRYDIRPMWPWNLPLQLQVFLDQLPEHDRQVLVLLFGLGEEEGKTHIEIGERLSIDPLEVGICVVRAVQQLRQMHGIHRFGSFLQEHNAVGSLVQERDDLFADGVRLRAQVADLEAALHSTPEGTVVDASLLQLSVAAQQDILVQTRNRLRANEVLTIGQLIQFSEEQLLAFARVGKVGVVGVKKLLAKLGLSLGMVLPRSMRAEYEHFMHGMTLRELRRETRNYRIRERKEESRS